MDELYFQTQNNIGNVIKRKRSAMHLSQQQLSEGICSQPLISAIENGTYMPNALLLFQLCSRLQIDINETFFRQFPTNKFFNDLDSSCRNQDFNKMNEILKKMDYTLKEFNVPELQLLNFFKVTLAFRTHKGFKKSVLDLEQILNLSYYPGKRNISVEERLLLAQLGFFSRLNQNFIEDENLFNLALYNIYKVNTYSEHLNVVFLLYLITISVTQDFNAFKKNALKAITFISENKSHYLLSSIFYIIWQKGIETSHMQDAKRAHEQFILLDELFHEPLLNFS